MELIPLTVWELLSLKLTTLGSYGGSTIYPASANGYVLQTEYYEISANEVMFKFFNEPHYN